MAIGPGLLANWILVKHMLWKVDWKRTIVKNIENVHIIYASYSCFII